LSSTVLRRLGDLQPIHQPGMNRITEHKLRQLSDDDLLATATNPTDGEMIKARPGSNRVLDGNTRVIEMQRRMRDPLSKIKPDTLVPVIEDF
jgi:hypothetical protein